ADEYGLDLKILKAVESVNAAQKTVLFGKIKKYFNNDLKGKTIAMWGLSFKPKTDDMREAPAIEMVNVLNEAGARVQAHDPEALEEAKWRFGKRVNNGITLHDKRYDALEGADALVIMTEWNEFREPDFYLIKETLSHPAIFDGRNIYNPKRMKKYGIDYFSIGRPKN
ncbi:MAG TPA: UDP-glucose/GDP-mannose dehydrogenase family protein, partial [Caldithrix abyssi]|nr:UDP-glucose/GDP-mannose dehydrogenase family protein [Caldithrix abyssi]